MNKIKILDSAFREYLNKDMEFEDNFLKPQTQVKGNNGKKGKRIKLLAYNSEM